jgi:hypothetical protein
MIFASLRKACTHVESMVCEDPSGSITYEIIPTTHIIETSDAEIHGVLNFGIDEVFVDQTTEMSTSTCTSQVDLNPFEEQKSLQHVDPVGDVVLVKNNSKDEPISIAYVANENEDPIFLISIEDDPTQLTIEAKVENANFVITCMHVSQRKLRTLFFIHRQQKP